MAEGYAEDGDINAGFADELDAWLNAAAQQGGQDPSDPYVVERTIKQTATEVTEVVRRRDVAAAGAGLFIRKTFAGDASRGNAYRRLYEAQLAGIRLSHVPIVYECAERAGTLAVICEYVRGSSLRELVERTGPGEQLLREVYPGLCDAVAELHTALPTPMIHRDIKPSNVIVGEGRVALIDLGIARDFAPGAARDTVRYGTPGYAPPEQYGYGQTTVASDLYALGMTLAFCLTGEDPTPPLVEGGFVDARIPAGVRRVLCRACAFDPAERYESATELRHDLDRALGVSLPLPNRRELGRASAVLGRIWNVVLVVFWAIVMYASVAAIVDPTPENAQYPTWFLVLAYVGFVMVPGTGIALALLDKRRLRKRVPLPEVSTLRGILYAALFTLACWATVFLFYFLFVYRW